jgi:TPR repeat protein
MSILAVGFRTTLFALTLLIADNAAAQQNSDFNIQELSWRAESGDPEAMHELGVHLLSDRSAPYFDDASGYAWLSRAADRGHWPSSYYLAQAILYRWRWPERESTAAENQEGIRWLEKAAHDAELGQGEDVFKMLGNIYAGDIRYLEANVPIDNAQAVTWYRLCAISNNSWCQASLGRILVEHIGDPDSVREGCQWLLQGAENGDPTGMYTLADAYRAGRCGRTDTAQAYIWFRRREIWQGRGICKSPSIEYEAQNAIRHLSPSMSRDAITSAQKQATDWHPREGVCWHP